MRSFNVIVERDPDTKLYVGYVPGWPGAHSQGATLDELEQNLREVIAMLLEDGDPKLESEFIGLRRSESRRRGVASRSEAARGGCALGAAWVSRGSAAWVAS